MIMSSSVIMVVVIVFGLFNQDLGEIVAGDQHRIVIDRMADAFAGQGFHIDACRLQQLFRLGERAIGHGFIGIAMDEEDGRLGGDFGAERLRAFEGAGKS